jgi:membrane-associated protein
MHFDLAQIIQTVGYIGLFAIVFAESGLFFGFFLPGDSLLLTAGLLASQDKLDLAILLII